MNLETAYLLYYNDSQLKSQLIEYHKTISSPMKVQLKDVPFHTFESWYWRGKVNLRHRQDGRVEIISSRMPYLVIYDTDFHNSNHIELFKQFINSSDSSTTIESIIKMKDLYEEASRVH